MSDQSTGPGGAESQGSGDQPPPDSDYWGDASSEGESEVRNAFVPGVPAYHGDRVFYRVVVFALAFVAVGALLGGVILQVCARTCLTPSLR